MGYMKDILMDMIESGFPEMEASQQDALFAEEMYYTATEAIAKAGHLGLGEDDVKALCWAAHVQYLDVQNLMKRK